MPQERTKLTTFARALVFVLAISFLIFPAGLLFAETTDITVTVSSFECNDGIDNDSDGLTDFPNDPGCSSATDDDETDVADCNDGIDNDGDGLTDYPDDPGCSSTSDTSEIDSGGSGGGGGGGATTGNSAANFSGRAYPGSTVTLLKDAQVAVTTFVGSDARFSMMLTGLSAGTFIFSLYSEDNAGRHSSLVTFTISLTAGATTDISGIFITPTIDVDKSEVQRGDTITIFGQSVPESSIIITVDSEETFFVNTNADKDGIYLYNFNTSPLLFGQHVTKSKSAIAGEISAFGRSVSFIVGTRTIIKRVGEVLMGNLNNDRKVNLIDFSIASFWYKRPLAGEIVVKEQERLNGDGRINLVDFSIMAFHWTG